MSDGERQGNEGDKGEDEGAQVERQKHNDNGNGENTHNSDHSFSRLCELWLEVFSPLIMVSLKHLCDRVPTVVVDRCLEYRNSQQRPLVTTTKTKKTNVALTSADNPSPAHAIKSNPKPSIPKPTATLPPHDNVTRIETSASSTQSLSGPLLILGFVLCVVLVILVMYCIRFRNSRILRKAKVDVEIDPTDVPLLRPRDYQDDSLAVASPHSYVYEVRRLDESTSSVTDLALEAVVEGSLLPLPRRDNHQNNSTWAFPEDNPTLAESLSPPVNVTLALATHIDVDPPSFTLSPEGHQSDSIAEPFDVDVDVALPAAIDPLAPAESLPLPNYEDLKDEFYVHIVQEDDDGISSTILNITTGKHENVPAIFFSALMIHRISPSPGPGNSIAAATGYPWVKAVTDLFNAGPGKTVYGGSSTPPSLIMGFTHDNNLPPVVAALGLWNTSSSGGAYPLSLKTPDTRREFRSSYLVAFRGYVAIERLACTRNGPSDTVKHIANQFPLTASTDSYVRVRINNAPVAIPGCTSGPGSTCPLNKFTSYMKQRATASGDFIKTCGLQSVTNATTVASFLTTNPDPSTVQLVSL
ncbi:hypothetical protein H0H93_000219 [Arthromyces matolae]|nr:hypothetical protein H0H93_000219 [Arthromyces matolae]